MNGSTFGGEYIDSLFSYNISIIYTILWYIFLKWHSVGRKQITFPALKWHGVVRMQVIFPPSAKMA